MRERQSSHDCQTLSFSVSQKELVDTQTARGEKQNRRRHTNELQLEIQRSKIYIEVVGYRKKKKASNSSIGVSRASKDYSDEYEDLVASYKHITRMCRVVSNITQATWPGFI